VGSEQRTSFLKRINTGVSLIFSVTVISLSMFAYFHLARKFGIVDHPNIRSSHASPTVRGAGIIFIVSVVLWSVTHDFTYPYMLTGGVLIAFVSFLDDVRPQSSIARLLVHIVAYIIMLYELPGFYEQSWLLVLVIFLIGIGTVNAFNFMDGINGITGVYSLMTLGTLYFMNNQIIAFTSPTLLIALGVSVAIFLFCNFRTNAYCFAGDVGSITIAFLLVFVLLQLIQATDSYGWFILLGIYAVDTIVTIIYRLLNRENLFLAHRSHLYQYLANELRYSHQIVSSVYGLLQLALNAIVLAFIPNPSFIEGVTIVVAIALAYIVIRELVMKRIGRRSPINLFNTAKS
jgi:UDP-GlcNAc:undecaprenyl-phosphate/decaprenyl-phosphate GlcNAc-1-phosphate transferase